MPRLDSEYRSAADRDAKADFTWLAKLLSAALADTMPFLPTLTLPRLQTEVLNWSATGLRHVASCSHHFAFIREITPISMPVITRSQVASGSIRPGRRR